MTTTPLPPHVISTDHPEYPRLHWTSVERAWIEARDKKFLACATQARADLEAENQRLEKFVHLVLYGCLRGRIKSPPIVIEDLEATDLKLISLADAARAALEGTK